MFRFGTQRLHLRQAGTVADGEAQIFFFATLFVRDLFPSLRRRA